MKKALSVLFLALACLSARADYTIISLTVTNTPTNGYTATINGKVITWTNTVFDTSVQVANTNTIGAVTTNLLNQLVASRVSGVQPTLSGTNAILLQSFAALTVSISTNWATLSTTNVVTTNATTVLSRFNNYTVLATRTNIASGLVSDLDTYSTTAFSAASPTLANHMALSTAQTVTGAKIFSGANVLSNANQFITGGGISNMALTNITYFQGSNGIIWALILVNPVLTNGVNYGNPFRSPGTANFSEQFGTSASATAVASTAFGYLSSASGIGATALGESATAGLDGATAVGQNSTVAGVNGTAVGSIAGVLKGGGTAVGYSASASHTNSTAIGQNSLTTTTNQVRLGTASESISIPGTLQVDGSISNATFAGSVTLQNKLITPKKSITTLVNSPSVNLVSTSTNTLLRLTGPTGAFSIGSFDGGTDGRILIVLNTTGQAMTVINESGATGTAADRILTNTGADVAISGSQQMVLFVYDITAGRWILGPKN